MKKILKIILAFLFAGTISFQTFSQSSYRVRIDSLITDECADCYKISKLASQNYVIACAGNDSNATAGLVILIDSLGNILWSKVYSFSPSVAWNIGFVSILPTSDSGYYFHYSRLDNVYNEYSTSNLMKVDKNGNIQHFKHSFDGIGTHGVALKLAFVEPNSDNLYLLATTYHYDGSIDEACCFRTFFVKYDTSLTRKSCRELTDADPRFTAIEINFNGARSGFLLGGMTYNSDSTRYVPSLERLDTLGNFIWKKSYLNNPHNIIKILQIDSCFYLLESTDTQTLIRKVDFNGNTIFLKEIEPAYLINGNHSMWSNNSSITIGNDGKLLISEIGTASHKPVLIEMDTLGNITQARIGLDSIYFNSFIDSKNNSFFFTRKHFSSSSIQFEREFISNTSCFFDTITMITSDIPFQDSSAGYHSMGSYVLTLYNDTVSFSLWPSFSTTECLSTNENLYNQQYKQSFQIFPNPSTGRFKIIPDPTIFQKIENLSLEIFNLLGEKAYSATYQEGSTVICQSFSKGIYFVRLSDSEKQLTKKLIIE